MALIKQIGKIDIPFVEVYSEWLEDEPDYTKLVGHKIFEPCGSAYSPNYTRIPGEDNIFGFSETTNKILQSHPRIVAIPIDSSLLDGGKVIKDAVPKIEGEVYCASRIVANDSRSIVAFVPVDNPTKWIGVVSYNASVYPHGSKINLHVEHELTYINPEFRGQLFGVVVSGMCGFMLSDTFKDYLKYDDYDDLLNEGGEKYPYTEIELSVSSEPVFPYSEYLTRSFADGVNFLLSGVVDRVSYVNYTYDGPVLEW